MPGAARFIPVPKAPPDEDGSRDHGRQHGPDRAFVRAASGARSGRPVWSMEQSPHVLMTSDGAMAAFLPRSTAWEFMPDTYFDTELPLAQLHRKREARRHPARRYSTTTARLRPNSLAGSPPRREKTKYWAL